MTASLLEEVLEIARVSSLEEMASGFAHEVNQPLGAVTTFAQAAKRMLSRPEPMITEALDVLEQISEETLKAGEMIRDIRRLFHQDNPDRSSHTMADVVLELRPLFEPMAQRHGIQLEIGTAPGIPKVMVDKLRIQHVLLVLFRNAIEASQPIANHPCIDIEVKADPYFVETSMSDQGIGIDPAAFKHIFMPFYTTKPLGTGLGLASSKAIIEKLGGTIGFESRPQGGTRFWFKVPISSDYN